jgi:hypothetical protein
VRSNRWVAAAAATFAIAVPVSQAPASKPVPVAVLAKSCGAGYTHAVINGAHKCLRRGQYCSRPADRQYHRYGYHCHKRDARGSYHLS